MVIQAVKDQLNEIVVTFRLMDKRQVIPRTHTPQCQSADSASDGCNTQTSLILPLLVLQEREPRFCSLWIPLETPASFPSHMIIIVCRFLRCWPLAMMLHSVCSSSDGTAVDSHISV